MHLGTRLARLEAIEAALLPAPRLTSHRVVVPLGQTQQEAAAAYAAAHGVDVEEVQKNVIYRIIVEARHE